MELRGQGGCLRDVGGVSRRVYWDLGGILLEIQSTGSDSSRCNRGQKDIFCNISIKEMILMNMFLSTHL